MEKTCGIYMITSPTGNIYIGQSNDVIRRKWEYASFKCFDQPRLYNSLKKYGWNAHTYEIIRTCKEHELNDFEKYYINKYNTFNSKHGMNLTSGGDHYKMSDETKLKISKSRIGIIYNNEIIEKTKETKRNRTYVSRAGNYEIYNTNNELIHKFCGDFRKTLKNLNIPYKSFNQSHKLCRKIKRGEFKGWYVIKL